jgi:phosphatidylglycerol:prolipoprotein diacylglycerol transferase
MHPELFEIPFIHWPVRSFGVMMVIGFLLGFFIIGKLSRNVVSNPQLITNLALYCLIAGVIGARIFYVVHHFDRLDRPLASMFAVWRGGLEFYGGVIFAIPVIVFYTRYHKLPVRQCLDIMAIALMLGLAFGRIGCFWNGCCFGKPSELPWAVRFPYDSFVYFSQINADPKRNRPAPQIILPHDEYSSYPDIKTTLYPKPFDELTEQQKFEVTKGKYRSLRIHPTQLYSSANAALLCLVLYLFWRRSRKAVRPDKTRTLFAQPGHTFALTFILYGITRFMIEYLRDDNPFEYAWWAIYKGGTVSQNLSIYLILLGVVLIALFQITKPNSAATKNAVNSKNRKFVPAKAGNEIRKLVPGEAEGPKVIHAP